MITDRTAMPARMVTLCLIWLTSVPASLLGFQAGLVLGPRLGLTGPAALFKVQIIDILGGLVTVLPPFIVLMYYFIRGYHAVIREQANRKTF